MKLDEAFVNVALAAHLIHAFPPHSIIKKPEGYNAFFIVPNGVGFQLCKLLGRAPDAQGSGAVPASQVA